MNKSKAQQLAEEAEFGGRHPHGWQKYIVPLIAASWSLFQLSLPQLFLLNSVYVRAIHLAFAILLVYFSFPMIKKSEWGLKLARTKPKVFGFLTVKHKISLVDFFLGALAAFSAIYLLVDYEGIAARAGDPGLWDIIFGITLVVLLLEAARRALGLALPLIASIFILYSFFSEYMPGLIAFKNASFSKVINKLTMGTEGIYGVPLDVSASTVFLFVLFGAMLDKAGGGQYFIRLAFSLLGGFRGGPGKASVLASGLTGMVSGSSIANTVTTGTFTIPLMKKAGYPAVKAGAIEVAASTNGQLMPPIMGAAAFIIAEYCNLSYFEVVKAAFVPAFISYLALIYITHLEALKLNLKPTPRAELPKFWETFVGGLHFLIPLFFLLYQLIIERRSAQLSAYYAILALVVTMFVKNLWDDLKSKEHAWMSSLKRTGIQIWQSLVSGGRGMMTIGVAVAAAGIVVGVVTLGLGGVITDVIDILSMGNLYLLLGITAIVSLILGMGLPTTANYIVMATLTAPVIVKLGGEAGLEVPLIAAHLFVFYFGILADDTPPVGLSAYAAAAISKADPIKTGIQGFKYDIRTALLPFMFIFNTDILLLGIHTIWEYIVIFSTSLIAMFAFAAATQGYFYRKLKWYEVAFLLLLTTMLFRPGFFDRVFFLDRHLWYIIGVTSFFALYFYQKWSSEKSNVSTTA